MQQKTRSWLVWGSISMLAVAALVAAWWFAFATADSDKPILSTSSKVEVQAKQGQQPTGSSPSAPTSNPVAHWPPPSNGPSATPSASGGERSSTLGRPAIGRKAALPGQSPISRPDDKDDVEHRPDDETGGGAEHQLTDRTGRGGNLAAQLNKEFMPLAAECIEMAKERNPKLAGMLSFAVNLVPIDDDKVLVASVELQKDNEIKDAELFECIEQSTLSIAGLKTPESFAITMPLTPDDADEAAAQ